MNNDQELEILVSVRFFASLENKCDLLAIINGKAKHLIKFKGKSYCLTGSIGTGTGVGARLRWAYEAVLLSEYKGANKPLSYHDHFDEARAGKRDRSYDGILLTYQKQKVVLVGPQITFVPQLKNLKPPYQQLLF